MTEYIEGLLEGTLDYLLGQSATPAENHLFEMDANGDPLGKVEAEIYYHLTMKLL